MPARAAKNRHAPRGGLRRRPSPNTIAKIEKRIAALPDLPEQAPISGTIGDIFFDDANTTHCSRCQADSGVRGVSTVIVEIEIYPEGDPDGSDSNPDNAHITLHFGGYCQPSDRETVQLNWHELEPLAVALSRAVANAKARGFLPVSGAAT